MNIKKRNKPVIRVWVSNSGKVWWIRKISKTEILFKLPKDKGWRILEAQGKEVRSIISKAAGELK